MTGPLIIIAAAAADGENSSKKQQPRVQNWTGQIMTIVYFLMFLSQYVTSPLSLLLNIFIFLVPFNLRVPGSSLSSSHSPSFVLFQPLLPMLPLNLLFVDKIVLSPLLAEFTHFTEDKAFDWIRLFASDIQDGHCEKWSV